MIVKLSKILINSALPNHITKIFNLELNVSLTFNKAPNLHSVTYSEMNTASITNKKLLLKEKGSYKFMFSLEIVTFYCKKDKRF